MDIISITFYEEDAIDLLDRIENEMVVTASQQELFEELKRVLGVI